MKKLHLIAILTFGLSNFGFAQSISFNNVQVYSNTPNYIDSVCISITGNGIPLSRIFQIQTNDACGTITMAFYFKGCDSTFTSYLDTCINLNTIFSEKLDFYLILDTMQGCTFPTSQMVTDTFLWDDCFLLSSKSLKNNLQINVYPNPAKDLLFIDLPEQIKLEVIELYSLNGKLVKRFNELERALIISEINTGFYFLRLRTENEVITKKVVVR